MPPPRLVNRAARHKQYVPPSDGTLAGVHQRYRRRQRRKNATPPLEVVISGRNSQTPVIGSSYPHLSILRSNQPSFSGSAQFERIPFSTSPKQLDDPSVQFLSEMESTRRIKVGYGLAPKKQSTIITPSLISYAAERGVDLVLIDATRRLCDQGPFDCVIHKLYDEGWRSQLRDFADRNPGVPIIDSLQAIERTQNRISMLEVVSELSIPPGKETLGVPEQVVVQDSEALSDPNSLASVRFPVIVKPLLATGAISHSLSLSFNREALVHLKLESPVVLQEFVNHGGVIFKAYVVGDQVECVKRKSLPDVTKEDSQNHQGIVPFSSVSNKPSSMEMEERFLNECRMPSPDFIAGVAKELRRVLELHLFNFDLIRDVRAADRYFLIDINYFPGYWKMPDYERMFTDFFLDIVHKSQRCRLDLCGGINPDRHNCEADTKTK